MERNLTVSHKFWWNGMRGGSLPKRAQKRTSKKIKPGFVGRCKGSLRSLGERTKKGYGQEIRSGRGRDPKEEKGLEERILKAYPNQARQF